jgi:hypothetical protein
VSHSPKNLDLISFDLHPLATTVPVAASRQFLRQGDRIELDALGKTLDDGNQAGPMALAGSQESKHSGKPKTERG